MPVETRLQRAQRLRNEARARQDWANLPPEILQTIFKNLDGAAFTEAVPNVCKVFRSSAVLMESKTRHARSLRLRHHHLRGFYGPNLFFPFLAFLSPAPHIPFLRCSCLRTHSPPPPHPSPWCSGGEGRLFLCGPLPPSLSTRTSDACAAASPRKTRCTQTVYPRATTTGTSSYQVKKAGLKKR